MRPPFRSIQIGITGKLLLLGATVVLATAILAGVSNYATEQIGDAMRLSMKSQMQVAMATDIRQKQLRAMFGALALAESGRSGEAARQQAGAIDAALKTMLEKAERLKSQTAGDANGTAAASVAEHLSGLAARIRRQLAQPEATPEAAAAFAAELLASDSRMEQDLNGLGGALRQGSFIAMKMNHEAIALGKRGSMIAAAVSLLLVLGGLAWVRQTTCKPVRAMTEAMGRLADGDHAVEIPGQGRRDEIGGMAGALQVFRDNAIRTAELEAERQALDRKAAEEKRQLMQRTADAFQAKIGELLATMAEETEQMRATAEGMAKTADGTNAQAGAVASASEEASTNVNLVASASQELSSAIRAITEQMEHSQKASASAVSAADHSRQTVGELVASAQRIGEVIAIISDIADRTNLLALNATIEAARAGEQGKGFAVVAGEVKHLANQTAKATDDIRAQIDTIQSVVQQAAASMEDVGGAVTAVSESAAAVSSAVSQQDAATEEIARNIERAAEGTQEVARNIAGVTKATATTRRAADNLVSGAADLSQQANTLQNETRDFSAQLTA
ncbi:MAG TPA: HAMP domain-containing methyl-accepting chemotaxis protein [Alphaproteobacteria bacterium]|nr:HAMP domain-containing methyl-accepting chemotaxis protein [Alphaproteobacteria bacterium]